MPAYADAPICETPTVGSGPRPEATVSPRPIERSLAKRGDWTALPEAAAILADCAADPPATRMAKVTDLTVYYARHYVGARVRRLGAIHRAEAERIFAACEAARRYDAFDDHCRLNVQQAIADALFHAALARSAACDARALDGLE
jgi:hypothetical protein